tara:strand:- start:5044 stop:5553 length:510 start_codon:yes stop_codon:yes gene_type:complete
MSVSLEYALIFAIAISLLYHFISRCNLNNGFSVGIQHCDAVNKNDDYHNIDCPANGNPEAILLDGIVYENPNIIADHSNDPDLLRRDATRCRLNECKLGAFATKPSTGKCEAKIEPDGSWEGDFEYNYKNCIRQDWPAYSEELQNNPIVPNQRILDAACGAGYEMTEIT